MFRFRIGETEFEVSEPTVEDLKRVEIEVTAPYLAHIKEGIVPEGSQIDSLLVHTLAAVKKPKLTAVELRKWPAKRWYALQMALSKTIDVNVADDVTFFPESNGTGDDSLDARIQAELRASEQAFTSGFPLSVTGSTISAAGVQSSAQDGAELRPRSVRKRAGGRTSRVES